MWLQESRLWKCLVSGRGRGGQVVTAVRTASGTMSKGTAHTGAATTLSRDDGRDNSHDDGRGVGRGGG